MSTIDPVTLDWTKGNGLLPAIVQDARSGRVLMQAWMNRAALQQTLESRQVTFFSRSRQRLWTKGETSGNFLALESAHVDCDADAILLRVAPQGPVCHRGTTACFDADALPLEFLGALDALIERRARERPQGSYTTSLFAAGTQRMAQKVGEEGVETALAAVTGNDAELLGESADLVFHLLVLLRARGLGLVDVARVLAQRHTAGQ
jgi:phosphoribosyl-ATP pyrophosphohydrolase/phosphoribosyl-AMP cyclohydrolase